MLNNAEAHFICLPPSTWTLRVWPVSDPTWECLCRSSWMFSVTDYLFLCLHHLTAFVLCPPSFPSSVPSAPPQDVRLHSLSSTSIRVSWVAPPTDSHHKKVAGYVLTYQAVKGQDLQRHQVSGIAADLTSYVLEDLDKWTEYLVWVKAHTDVGPGPESPAALIRTMEDGMLMMTRSNPIHFT